MCEEDEGKPLQISHQPEMSASECRKVGLAIKVENCFCLPYVDFFLALLFYYLLIETGESVAEK